MIKKWLDYTLQMKNGYILCHFRFNKADGIILYRATVCQVDVFEIYEASFKATDPLHIRLVKGAFCLAVRATRLLSTIRELLLFW